MSFNLKNISVRYGEKIVLDDLSLSFPEQESTALLSPSGGGKTTLLRVIAGLTEADRGECTGFPERFSYMSQETQLFPWMDNLKNLEMIRPPGEDKQQWRQKALALLKTFGLGRETRSRPAALSGGMQRRLELVRAILYPAPLLLLDEPFASLDINLRREVSLILKKTISRSGRTLIFSTHHVDTALMLADRLYIFSGCPSGSQTPAPNPLSSVPAEHREKEMRQHTARIAVQMMQQSRAL